MRTIDADALFINLEGMMEVSPTGYIHGDTIADMISDAPTIEPEPKWIPCSERLPEVGKWVLCQCRAGIFDVLWLSEGREWNNAFATYMSSFVIAWMPLPEPYKENK